MIAFRLDRDISKGDPIVEVLEDGKVVGVIYAKENMIRIVSAHISRTAKDPDFEGAVIPDDGKSSWPPIPSVYIYFNPKHYVITPEGIKKIEP